MLDVTIEINTWISEQQEFSALLQQLDLQSEAIVWSDDMAIPWLTARAADLPVAVENLLAKVHQVFMRRGFDLNMQKTTAVLTFRGSGAPELRREFQLNGASGMQCRLDDTRECWLHIVPAYKHLGTFFATDGGFDAELKHRIGQAMSAFSVLSRQVLCNKHLHVRVRLRLFHALVGTRLFFGLGAWPTPTVRQIATINSALVRCLRRILGVAYQGGEIRTTDAQVFAWARCPDARVRIAQDRLLLAHKLFMQGPAFLHHLLHREYSCSENSWLHGVFADLKWLHALDPSSVPASWTLSPTEPIEFWQTGGKGWKSTVRRLGRRHVYQEMMMMEVHDWHHKFFKILASAGATFAPEPFDKVAAEVLMNHSCFCGRVFSSAVGLATHQRKAHQIMSLEHDLLSGATCPACLKHFWTTQRLQQHLAYVSRRTGRNECYQQLRKAGYIAEYERTIMPQCLLGMDRANWIQSAGPANLMPDMRINEIARCEQLLLDLREEYLKCDSPAETERLRSDLFVHWTEQTFLWLQDFRGANFDPDVLPTLTDRWIDALSIVDPQYDKWIELCFQEWGKCELGEAIAQFEDGEAEALADAAFLDLFSGMPLFAHEQTCTKLRLRIKALMEAEPGVSHRPIYIPSRPRARQCMDEIPMLYEGQQLWHDKVRLASWERQIPCHKIPRLLRDGTPHFVVVHLFSGRRRANDVHFWLAKWATMRGVNVTVLSMDTAVSCTYGNLNVESVSWSKLIQLYSQGAISATLAGAPCETYSAARHLPPPEGTSGLSWPRPLRSSGRLFGLPFLTNKELQQCRQGTSFSLQTLYVAALHLAHGGVFLSEHPACPDDPQKASVWRTAIVELLRMLPECHLHTFPQWKWGSKTPKPTGLLCLGLPMAARSMYSCADETLTYPQSVAQGVGDDGHFRTAACKEYPPLFCKGLAKTLTDRFEQAIRLKDIRDVLVEVDELHA
eukprot:s1033_g18.t1